MRHGPPTDQPSPSLAGRRGGRRRPRRPARRPDPGRADPRPRRPSGPGLSRPDLDAGPVPRRRLRIRAADGDYSQHNMPDFPLIGLIWHRNGQQPAEQWHTDHTNREHPPAATILHGVEIPSAGGGTSVASMRAAYLALPVEERRRLEALTTFNGLDGHADTRPEDREKYGRPVEHPMVRTHPVHGSKAVYFHISKATHVSGMTPEASRAYLRDLLDR